MFIPLNTDAPIYHWPWVTLSLIVVNVVAFFFTGGDYDDAALEGWVLQHGSGLHPLEWVTCNFIHIGVFHLIVNMIFLWGFGLVVEGKIGWWKYLLVYMGIGIGHAFIEQVIMLGASESASAGASGVIFGLLAISLVWAPKNEVSVLFFFWLLFFVRVFTFDVTILTFSLYYIGFQVVFAALKGFAMGSEVIHLLGALLGFGVGTLMLKRNWVDCENWDLYAVLDGSYGNRDQFELHRYPDAAGAAAVDHSGGRTGKQSRKETPLPEGDETLDQIESGERRASKQVKTVRRIRELLDAGKPNAALSEYRSFKRLSPQWQLDHGDLKALADALYKDRSWTETIPLMEEFIERFPADSARMRLKLAGVVIEIQRRPRYAQRLIDQIPPDTLIPNFEEHKEKVVRAAQQLIDDGVIELDGQAWA